MIARAAALTVAALATVGAAALTALLVWVVSGLRGTARR